MRIAGKPARDGLVMTAKAAMSKKYGLVRNLYYFLLNTIGTIERKPKINLDYIAIEPVSG
jgi:hypothetical protein